MESSSETKKYERSNAFANTEAKFINASEEEITDIARTAVAEIVNKWSETGGNDQSSFYVLLEGAKVGINRDSVSEPQKKLLRSLFEAAYSGSMEEIYSAVEGGISEADYNILSTLAQPQMNSVAMPLLDYILCFSYIDGVIDDEVAERLDPIYGMCFLKEFFESGAEEMPVAKKMNKLTDELEIRIIKWLMIDNKLPSFEMLIKHFSEYSQEEIKKARDSLIEKGLIEGGDKIFNGACFLVDENVEIYDSHGELIEIGEVEALKEIARDLPIVRSIEGTAYSGRIDRIEHIEKGDKLILRADYNSEYYSPVAVEVFNTDGETLGFLKEELDLSLKAIAMVLDYIDARVADVTPLSKRRKNAKYALMDVELSLKDDVNLPAERTEQEDSEDSELDTQIAELTELNQQLTELTELNQQLTELDRQLTELVQYVAEEIKAESEQLPENDLVFTFKEGLKVTGLGYSISVPDGFRFKRNMEEWVSIMKRSVTREFVAWSSKELEPAERENAEIAILSSEVSLENMSRNPSEWFDEMKAAHSAAAKMTNCEVRTKSFSNGSVFGGYTVQRISDNCVNYHCFVGEKQNAHQFRIIINKPYSQQSMDDAVESWLKTMECKITNKDKAKLKQLETEAEKGKADSALEQTKEFANDVRTVLQDLNKAWRDALNDLKNQIATKIYMSQDELNRDMRTIVTSRDKFGRNYDELISQIDENGEKLLTAGADSRANKEIFNLIDEVIEATKELNLDFSTTGTATMDLGSANFRISSKSTSIRVKWKNRYEMFKTSVVSKEEMEKQESAERQKAEKLKAERQKAAEKLKAERQKAAEKQEAERQKEYEQLKDSINQAEAEVLQAETDIEKLQEEIFESEKELRKQNRKLIFKDKSLVNKLSSELSEKRAKLEELQQTKEKTSQNLRNMTAKFKTIDFEKKYPICASMKNTTERIMVESILNVLKETRQKEWTVSELMMSSSVYLRGSSFDRVFDVLRKLSKDGLVERNVIKKHAYYKLCENVNVEDVLEQLSRTHRNTY